MGVQSSGQPIDRGGMWKVWHAKAVFRIKRNTTNYAITFVIDSWSLDR